MIYPILALISIGNRTILNCVSPLCGRFSVKIERFQIKSNVLNLKSTLQYGPTKKVSEFKICSNISSETLLTPQGLLFKILRYISYLVQFS